jgi:hypothetical protein
MRKSQMAKTLIDSSEPAAIARAIKKVNQTPGLRIKPGADALWRLLKAPEHALSRSDLEKEFGALDLHFGWFCRRVAEELGVSNPDTFALVDSSKSADGDQILTLKPSVVAAFGHKKTAGKPK